MHTRKPRAEEPSADWLTAAATTAPAPAPTARGPSWHRNRKHQRRATAPAGAPPSPQLAHAPRRPLAALQPTQAFQSGYSWRLRPRLPLPRALKRATGKLPSFPEFLAFRGNACSWWRYGQPGGNCLTVSWNSLKAGSGQPNPPSAFCLRPNWGIRTLGPKMGRGKGRCLLMAWYIEVN